MSADSTLSLHELCGLRYRHNPQARNAITCAYANHGKRCQCAATPGAPLAQAPAPPPKPAAAAPAPRPQPAAKPPNPDIIYAPGDLPDEPATPDTPNGTPASPISIGPDGEPLIPLRLANRYFMLLWGAILRGLAPYPEARNNIAKTLEAYSRYYPAPFAQG